MQRPLFQCIASAVDALHRCEQSSNETGMEIHREALRQFDKILPSGSGIDSGCIIDRERSNANKIVIGFSYHHMNDGGYYDGWTDHVLIVTPSLARTLNLRITGKDRRQIKEYLYDTFHYALTDLIDYDKGAYYSVSMREAAERFQQGVADGTIV